MGEVWQHGEQDGNLIPTEPAKSDDDKVSEMKEAEVASHRLNYQNI